jgi:hypothetical protein
MGICLKVTFPSLKYALLPEIDTEIVGDNGKLFEANHEPVMQFLSRDMPV